MIEVLGHIIRPNAVDYISAVEKVSVMSSSTYHFTLTLFINGQRLVLQSDTKGVLEKNRIDILNALVYDRVKDQGIV